MRPLDQGSVLADVEGARFAEGFLWGASTASHQVEGGNRWNDWWEYEEAGRLPYRSGEACRHYELYEQDFALARSLGHNAHRISLEWSRIEPVEGQWNGEAITHYRKVLRAMHAQGLTPVVTLQHFTCPAWFTRRGGWVRADSVNLFRRYARHVASELGGEARHWLTINEPTVFIKHAYVTGDWPPLLPGSPWKALRALFHMCRAHVAAYRELHAVRMDALVGFAHSAPYVQPCRGGSLLDRLAARARDFVLNDACFLMMGLRPARVLDFVGLNYYTRQIARWRPQGRAWLFGVECKENHHGEPRRFNTLGWEIHPDGLRQVLRRFSRLGRPMILTENGLATADEEERTGYLERHVAALARATGEGLDVRGYFYWTLMDNYEWTAGYTAQFGLAAVDFATQQRLPRPAALRFRELCEAARRPFLT